MYASTGEIHPPEQRAEEVLGLHEMGFQTVKLWEPKTPCVNYLIVAGEVPAEWKVYLRI